MESERTYSPEELELLKRYIGWVWSVENDLLVSTDFEVNKLLPLAIQAGISPDEMLERYDMLSVLRKENNAEIMQSNCSMERKCEMFTQFVKKTKRDSEAFWCEIAKIK